MKKLCCVLISLSLLISTASLCAAQTPFYLAEDGATGYRIVVSSGATEAEQTAAATLADYLLQITGAVFPIVTDDEAPTAKEIVVGRTNRSEPRGDFDDDAVDIYTDSGKLFLCGGSARGALYSVYTFLEDELGCRWFTHDLTVVPANETLLLPDVDYTYEPPFKLRQTYWLFSTMYPDFCAAHKLHGVMSYMPESLGGGRYEMAVSSVHTMQQIVPTSLFENHPEYFGCRDDGVRSVNRQPCLSNEDVFGLAMEYANSYFSQYNAVLSISQNDNLDFCQCEKCRSFNKAHGGTDSASLLRFIDRVADEIKKTYPDAMIETLAYQNSQKPPEGLTVADNVVIRLCGVNTCTLHALDDSSCPSNRGFCSDLAGWAALTDNIYIWEYSTNFQYYYAFYPNITSMQERYRFYRDNNAVAIFDNGCGDYIVPGELHELRTYLTLKLLWDPDTDVERHMREFCEAYYGTACDDVIEFIKTFEKASKGWNIRSARFAHTSCHDGGVGLLNNTSLTSCDVKELDSIMLSAESHELNEEQASHIKGFSLSWRFYKNAAFLGEFKWFSGFTYPEEATKQLVSDMRDYGVTALSEGGALYLGDTEPDARMMPTFWFTDESELSGDVLTDMRFRVFSNRFLRTVCAPLRALLSITA
ncbi:MAG: DUF4838 domain-containing protein [Clostridia bacterium]|nr:DUF4838 domain-containing protein [Clostridia bacterium]